MKKKHKEKAKPPDGKELPGPKGVFEFQDTGEKLEAYEGLGENGDTVALRCMPLDAKPGMLGVISPYKDKWIFSVREGHAGGGHQFASHQVIKYLEAKGESTAILYFGLYRDSIRFNVEGSGPRTKFMLDPEESAERLDDARRVLKELGVPEDRVGLADKMAGKG